MSIIDIIIILIILYGAFQGFRNGFTTQLVSAVGFFLVFVLAFIFKGPVGSLLAQMFPFFSFGGILKGITSVNVILYEGIAFVLLVILFMILLRVLLMVTGIFEKLLNITFIFGIPSKIAGSVIGVIQYYIFVFIGLYILSMPAFGIGFIEQSKFREPILNQTPLLSGFTEKGLDLAKEIEVLKDKYKTEEKTQEFNLEVVDLLLKYKIVDVETIEKLVRDNKLEIDNIYEVINKYKEGNE